MHIYLYIYISIFIYLSIYLHIYLYIFVTNFFTNSYPNGSIKCIKKDTVEMQEDFLRKFCSCVCYLQTYVAH